MERECKESLNTNFKTRKRVRLELDLEPGTSVVFVAEKLRKRKVDICGQQKLPWRGQGACFIGVKRRSYGGHEMILERVV